MFRCHVELERRCLEIEKRNVHKNFPPQKIYSVGSSSRTPLRTLALPNSPK